MQLEVVNFNYAICFDVNNHCLMEFLEQFTVFLFDSVLLSFHNFNLHILLSSTDVFLPK